MSETEIRELIRAVVEELGYCPRYLSPAQVSELTGFSRKSLEHMRLRGEGPRYVRVGRRNVRYKADDVRRWIEGDAPLNLEVGEEHVR